MHGVWCMEFACIFIFVYIFLSDLLDFLLDDRRDFQGGMYAAIKNEPLRGQRSEYPMITIVTRLLSCSQA